MARGCQVQGCTLDQLHLQQTLKQHVGSRLWSRLEPSLLKLGPPPLVWAMRIMSAARRRKRLANSSLRWIKLGTGKFVSVLGLPTTLRRTRRVITDNFATTLAPASRVLDLGLRNSFPSHPLPII